MFYITGDIHGDITRIEDFCNRLDGMLSSNDVMIILGDCGFNYYLNKRDSKLKEKANNLGIIIFCVKGNHELHPDMIPSYKTKEWNGGTVYFEEKYPNLLFAKDGEIYDFDEKKVFVMGGAYSVDKFYRIMRGWHWFDSEQPSEETKVYGMKRLESVDWKVDIVLTHTAPLSAEPRHLFLSMIDQSTVDKTTEIYLQEISEKLDFQKWYFGHFHGDWTYENYKMLFESIGVLGE